MTEGGISVESEISISIITKHVVAENPDQVNQPSISVILVQLIIACIISVTSEVENPKVASEIWTIDKSSSWIM